MPVVKIFLDRFARMVGSKRHRIIDRLPYLGLDIESVDDESIRVEYNPNRPDFSTDYGIARALRGLMRLETGLPTYSVRDGRINVFVNRNLAKVRPYIACAVARYLQLDDESIRQIISMQEDLHNGLGRRRAKVSIGLHNLDGVVPPVHYEGKPSTFSFVPLGESRVMTVAEVLKRTETGRAYGRILSGAKLYPILRDSLGTVLSFPPIINGTATKVDTRTRSLFIDVTSTDETAGEDTLAVLVSTLAEAGASLESVRIKYSGKATVTPDLTSRTMRMDEDLVNAITGLNISRSQVKACLRRCRIDLAGASVVIPRYRVDILHPVDIAEEVAIGYGLDKVTPLYPASYQPGSYDRSLVFLNWVSETMARSGFIETLNYELIDEASLYTNFGRGNRGKIEVENPRSLEHCVLRDSILPSLMTVLSRNIKEEYPQMIFEVGTVYLRSGSRIFEESHLGAAIAHTSTTYSEAKMHLSALIREQAGGGITTRSSTHWAFADGRCAEVILNGTRMGHVGEVKPSVVASFGLGVPVSAFEVDLGKLSQRNA
ncbi:MAG: phenylalanine--tRNA ligase subunit beta [Thaumarchaeota archaeon]|nr:phenylalanine--tRNA ligase subunit beta [Nitrososphaerota archaeon]